MSEDTFLTIVLIALLIISAFFSGSETAIIGSRRVSLHDMRDKGSRSAGQVLKLLNDPGTLLGTILVGNNLVNVAAAAIGATLFGPAAATLIVTAALLLIGEVPPKTMAAMQPERLARLSAYPITLFTYVFRPVVWLTNTFTDLLLLPFTNKFGHRRRFFSRDELRAALDISQDAGELEPGEAQIIQEVLDLEKVKIKELMIPLDQVAYLFSDWDLESVMAEIRSRRFTRYPVLDPRTRKPIGFLHIKDLLVRGGKSRPWRTLLQPMLQRDEDMFADDLLRDMQIARMHMVAAIDKNKHVIGFVTMERVLEEIVGEIADEHDLEADPIRTLGDGVYQVRADLEIADISRILNIDIPVDDPELSVREVYQTSSRNLPTSGLKLGRVLLRPSKHAYIVQVLPEPENGDEVNGEQRQAQPA